jgi:hypothetical protein
MRGGAKQYIGELTPEITSAETLDENCTCLYISAHGEAYSENVCIVPENTFILFTGQSGIPTTASLKDRTWLISANSRKDYFQTIYDTYFHEGESVKPRPYADQHVYIPGDIIPAYWLRFEEKQLYDGIWYKGVYECPLKQEKAIDMFTSTPSSWTYRFINHIDSEENKDVSEAMKNAEFKEEKRDEWEKLKTLSDAEMKVYGPHHKKSMEDMKYWFEKPELLVPVINKYLMSNSENRLPFNSPIFKQPYQSYLYRVLDTIPANPGKKYKFVIVTACRSPINYTGSRIEFSNINKYSATDPKNLPATMNKTRKLHRRFSFSAKPRPLACATTDDPPMNILRIADALQKVKRYMPIGAKEDYLIGSAIDILFIKETNTLKHTFHLADLTQQILDLTFQKFPILTDMRRQNAVKRTAFMNLISSIKRAFGTFLLGVHMDTPEETRKAKTLGTLILEQVNYVYPYNLPYTANISEQEAFLSSLRENKTTTRNTSLNESNTKGKDLLAWRLEWLSGRRNNASKKMLGRWSAYRRTLTEEERKKQNAELKAKMRQ